MRSGIVTRKALFLMVVIVAALVAADHDQVSGGIGTWTAKMPIPTARAGLAVGVVDGILYAVGGDTGADPYLSLLEAYNPTTNTWKSKATMPTARSVLAVGVVNGILYAVGGISKHVAGRILDTVEAYNPATDTWTTKAPMPTPRFGLAVGVVDGILYAVGGGGGQPLTTVESYDPATNAWTTRAPMPTMRNPFFAAGVVNGILYVVGGSCCNPGHGSRLLGTLEAYNPTKNAWTTKPPMPTPRLKFAAGVVNQVLYAVGGETDDGLVGIVEAYDPIANRWTSKAALPSGRFLHAAGAANGILYVTGGVSAHKGGAPPNDLIAYFPRDLLAFKP